MTGDEEAFVVWFISAHPAKKQAIISTTIIHFALFTCFLPVMVSACLRALKFKKYLSNRSFTTFGSYVQ
jgi:hypothetical protein